MANTLTNLIPTLYEALDVVSRELQGFIPAVDRDSNVQRAAKDQSVRVPITPAATAADNTPGVTAPDTGDQTIGSTEITISKSRHVPVRFNGEEVKGLDTAGTYRTIIRDRFVQGFRTLSNEIEADIAGLYTKASRAYGTAGTTPFGTINVMSDFAGARRVLDENGAPQNDLQIVLGHAAMANLRGVQATLFRANEAGRDDMLRDGMTDRVQGFAVRTSGEIDTHTAGTASGATTDATGYAVGSTAITLASAGTGTILTGDVITFAGDTNKYVVVSGDADVSNGGAITIAAPGLRVAIPTSATAITVVASYAANMAFSRNAIVLATRLPALPEGGDSADDAMTIVDPHSGLAFEIAVYRQYLQSVYHVRLAWGFELIKPEHTALLLG